MDNKKPNDWFVASILSPEKNFQDFKFEGVTPENTTIQNRDTYKNNKKIQERFLDANGAFDEAKFNSFYDATVTSYNKFANDEFDDTVKKSPEVFRTTTLLPKKSKIIDPFKVVKVSNPFEETRGLQGLNTIGESKLSIAELAQKNSVKDHKTGKDLGWTPNEDGGILGLFSKPTVALAQYDEDSVVLNAETGRVERHKKGDFKLNEDGKFYYETIGKRDPAGKQILSVWDSNTVDGSFANKFDFMDSDDKEKSIGGSIMKTVARVAPMFIPVVGEYYAGATVGLELMDLLPTLAQSGASLFLGEDQKNKDYYKSMTSLRSFKRSLDTGVSEYSKQNVFTPENILQMVGDVFGQLKQQKLIASIPQKIGWGRAEAAAYRRGVELYGDDFVKFMETKGYNQASLSNKLAMMSEEIPELGKMIRGYDQLSTAWAMGLSNMYMAGTSAIGVVDDARNNGLSEKETAALFLGTMAGYSTMMAKFEIGHWATKGLGLDETGNLIKKSIRENLAQIQPTLKNAVKEVSEPKRLDKIFSIGKKVGKYVSNKITNIDDYAGAMIGEGIEEVTEEAMADSVKSIYNGFSSLGMTPTKDTKFEFKGEEMVQRYAMSLLGGALGGVIFKASERLSENGFNNNSESEKKDLIYLIRNGHAEEYLREIDKFEEKGLAGNTNLSMDLDESSNTLEGTLNYKPAKDSSNSQNAYVANVLRSEVNAVKNIIFQEGVPSDEMLGKVYNTRMQGVIDFNVNTSVRDDVDNITSKIIGLKAEINNLKVDSENADGKDASILSKISERESQLADLSFELKKIASGEYYEKYLSEGLFNINTGLNSPFSVKDENRIALEMYNKPINELSREERQNVTNKYKEYINSDRRDDLKKAKVEFDDFFKKVSGLATVLNDYGDQRFGYYNSTLGYRETEAEFNRTDEELTSVNKNAIQLGVFNPAVQGEDDAVTLTNILNNTRYIDSEIEARANSIFNNVKINDPDLVGITNDIDVVLGNINPDGSHVLENEDTAEFFRDIYGYFELPSILKLKDYSSIKLSELDEFYENMKDYYKSDEFKEKLEEETYGNFENTEFIKALDSFVNKIRVENAESIAKIEALKAAMKNKSKSPIQDLISKFNISDDPSESKTVFDLLSQEFTAMDSKQDLTQYVIENQVTYKQIDKAIALLNKLQASLNGATNFTYKQGEPIGYISAINKFKEDSGAASTEPVSIRANSSITKDINIIKMKLAFLRKLSQLNQENKVKNQKQSGLMAQGLFFQYLSEDDGLKAKLKEIGVDFERIDELIDNSAALKNIAIAINDSEGKTQVDITDDNYKNAELELTRIESELYGQFQKALANDKTANDKVNALFDPAVLKDMDATEFTSVTKTLKEYDKFIYLNSILNSDSAKFRKELYGEEGEVLGESPFAPFFSQEYYSRLYYWMLENQFSYNKAVHYFANKNIDDKDNPLYNEYKDYLYDQLYNTLIIFGRPGVGKTTGTISIIGKLLANRDKGVAVYGPTESQGGNLADSLFGSNIVNEAGKKNKEDVISLFIKPEVYEKIKADRDAVKFEIGAKLEADNVFVMKESKSRDFTKPVLNKEHELLKDFYAGNNASNDLIIDGKQIGAIIIDEITHYSSDEIELIHQGVLNHNKKNKDNKIQLIIAGDPMQSGSLTNGFNNNINFFTGITGPYLSISMRSGYNLKSANLDAAFSTLSSLNNMVKEANYRITDTQVQEFLESTDNVITLKYSNEEKFIGDKISDAVTKSDLEKMLSNTNSKIAVITDDENSDFLKVVKSMPDFETKFDIKTPDKVQGLEYDYALIDVKNPNAKENIRNAKAVAKSLNTMISRSKVGSIISNRSINGLPVTSDDKDVIPVNTELPKTQIEEFKVLRIESLKNTLENAEDADITGDSAGEEEEEQPKEEGDPQIPSSENPDGDGNFDPEPEGVDEDDEDELEITYEEPSGNVLTELRTIVLGSANSISKAIEDKKTQNTSGSDGRSFMFTMYERLGINLDVYSTGTVKAVDPTSDIPAIYSLIYGEEVEPGTQVDKVKFDYAIEQFKRLKGALYQYPVSKNSKDDNGWSEYNMEDHLKAFGIDRRIISGLNLESMEVGVKVAKFNALTDKSASLDPESPMQTKTGLSRFVVVRVNDNDGNQRSFTIATLPNPYVENNKVKGFAKNVPEAIANNIAALDSVYEKSGEESYFFKLKKGFDSIGAFTNMKIIPTRTPDGTIISKPLEKFVAENPHLTVSSPYIFSGSEFTIKNSTVVSESDPEALVTDDIYTSKIVGRPVVLVSIDKSITESNMKAYFEAQIKESIEEHNFRIEENKKEKEAADKGETYEKKRFERHYPDVVKMIPLNNRGTKFSDWYDRQISLINAPASAKDKVLKLKMNGDRYVGAKLYNSLYNFILDIDFLKKNSKISYVNDVFGITPNRSAESAFNYYSKLFETFKFPVRGQVKTGIEAALAFQEHVSLLMNKTNEILSKNGTPLEIKEGTKVGSDIRKNRLLNVYNSMPDTFDIDKELPYANSKYNLTYTLFNALKTVISGGKLGGTTYSKITTSAALPMLFSGLDIVIKQDFPSGIFHNTITLSPKKRTLTEAVPFIIETENPIEHYSIDVKILGPTMLLDMKDLDVDINNTEEELDHLASQEYAINVDKIIRTIISSMENIDDDGKVALFDSLRSLANNYDDAAKFKKAAFGLIREFFEKNPFFVYGKNYMYVRYDEASDSFDSENVTSEIKSMLGKSTSVESNEAQRDDIERRRQKELDEEGYRVTTKSELYKSNDGTFYKVEKLKNSKKKISISNENGNTVTPLGSYDDSVSLDKIIDGGLIKVKDLSFTNKIVDKVNAKYDAELAALKGSSNLEIGSISYVRDNNKLKGEVFNVNSEKIAIFEHSYGKLKVDKIESTPEIQARVKTAGDQIIDLINSTPEVVDGETLISLMSRINGGYTQFSNAEQKAFTEGMANLYMALKPKDRETLKQLTEELTNRISCL